MPSLPTQPSPPPARSHSSSRRGSRPRFPLHLTPSSPPASARAHTAASSTFLPATRNDLSTSRKLLESRDSNSQRTLSVSCTASTNDKIRSTRRGCTIKPTDAVVHSVPTSMTYCGDGKGQKQKTSSGKQNSHTPGMHTGSQLLQHCRSTFTLLLGI